MNFNGNKKGGADSEESKFNDEQFYQIDIESEILHDLNTIPKYSDFFEKFNKESVKEFKEYYAKAKAAVILDNGKALEYENQNVLQYESLAEECIWQIQQRKLFDLQIKWRSKQIEIEEIKVTAEFEEWANKIEQCQFISKISQEEFDLYISFIENTKMENIQGSIIVNWQAYNDFKSQYHVSNDFIFRKPEWYEYYENKTGLGSLYLLEDVRGEKELFYKRIYFEYEIQLRKKCGNLKSIPEDDGKPWLWNHDKHIMTKFVNECEDGNFINKWNAFLNKFILDNDHELNNAINILKTSTETWGINYNEDWRQGIINAADEYKRKRLLDALPKAFHDYSFRVNTGLAFDSHFENQYLRDTNKEKEEILKGRELNREPKDFNY